MRTLDFVENENLRRDLPPFKVGDTVAVHVTVREGDKERIQVFQGLVIRRRGGGVGETFTVRKISSGVGVERIFPVQSPLVTKVEIKARGYVRRSRLYYLRNLSGKKARLHSKVRDLSGLISDEEAEALANADDDPGGPGRARSSARNRRGRWQGAEGQGPQEGPGCREGQASGRARQAGQGTRRQEGQEGRGRCGGGQPRNPQRARRPRTPRKKADAEAAQAFGSARGTRATAYRFVGS